MIIKGIRIKVISICSVVFAVVVLCPPTAVACLLLWRVVAIY